MEKSISFCAFLSHRASVLKRFACQKSSSAPDNQHMFMVLPSSRGRFAESTFTGRNGAGSLLPSCFKRRSLGPAAVAQPSDNNTNMNTNINMNKNTNSC